MPDALRILVRDAESTYNVEKRIDGDPAIPVPLNARGRAEAADLALHIAHEKALGSSAPAIRLSGRGGTVGSAFPAAVSALLLGEERPP